MLLSELLATPDLEPALRGLKVAGLTADSRTARDGFAFFAIPGHAGDGLTFVADAAARGARVVVAQRRAECPLPLIVVDDVRARPRARGRAFLCAPAVDDRSGDRHERQDLHRRFSSPDLERARP